MTADWDERAAYQRAVESAKNQIALLVRERDEARRESAALYEEIAHRAKIDAEDMQRIQERYDHLYRQFDSLQKWVARGMALQPPPPIVVQSDSAGLLAVQASQERALQGRLLTDVRWSVERKEFAYISLRDRLAAYDATVKGT
jgi:hypothetical protein